MKTTTFGPWCAGTVCKMLLVCTLFLGSYSAEATIFPANNADILVASGVNAQNVNCDMIEHSSGNLRAIAYDDFNTGNGYVNLQDNSGGNLTIYIPGGLQPDVVIGDDINNPGNDYIVAVVYGTTTMYLNTYMISGAGSGTLMLNGSTSNQVSALTGASITAAHIDLYPDLNALPIGSFAPLYDYVVTWAEKKTPGTFDVSLASGSLSTPGTFSTVLLTSRGQFPDVACLWELSTSHIHACIAYQNTTTGKLDLVEHDLTNGNITTTTSLSPGVVAILKGAPRIEAMNQYDALSGYAKYEIAYPLTNMPGGIQIWGYTDIGGNVNISTSGFSGTNNLHTAVAAGVGSISGFGGYCNDNYTVGWLNTTSLNYTTAVVDVTTGTISTSFPDYYEANMKPSSSFAYYYSSLGVSSSSNSGTDLLTAWSDGDDSVWYKYTGDVTAYKPTNINEVKNNEYKLYPNPAGNNVYVMATGMAAYAINDVTGRLLLQGNLKTGENVLDIAGLKSGIYVMSIMEEGQKLMLKFVKQ